MQHGEAHSPGRISDQTEFGSILWQGDIFLEQPSQILLIHTLLFTQSGVTPMAVPCRYSVARVTEAVVSQQLTHASGAEV